jgi:hypothetical protein
MIALGIVALSVGAVLLGWPTVLTRLAGHKEPLPLVGSRVHTPMDSGAVLVWRTGRYLATATASHPYSAATVNCSTTATAPGGSCSRPRERALASRVPFSGWTSLASA